MVGTTTTVLRGEGVEKPSPDKGEVKEIDSESADDRERLLRSEGGEENRDMVLCFMEPTTILSLLGTCFVENCRELPVIKTNRDGPWSSILLWFVRLKQSNGKPTGVTTGVRLFNQTGALACLAYAGHVYYFLTSRVKDD